MVINWYGEDCFKIQSGEFVLLIDPFESSTGLTPPRFKSNGVLKTIIPYPLPRETTETAVVAGPGEYEIGGAEISGWRLENGAKATEGIFLKTAYVVKLEDIRLGFLGHARTIPSPDTLEALSQVDILFIPGGGAPYLSQEQAAKLIKQISPKIAIPSLFKTTGLTRKADDVKAFLDELDQHPKPEPKLTIKKKDLPTSIRVMVLSV